MDQRPEARQDESRGENATAYDAQHISDGPRSGDHQGK